MYFVDAGKTIPASREIKQQHAAQQAAASGRPRSSFLASAQAPE